jgi:hypothetical protein
MAQKKKTAKTDKEATQTEVEAIPEAQHVNTATKRRRRRGKKLVNDFSLAPVDSTAPPSPQLMLDQSSHWTQDSRKPNFQSEIRNGIFFNESGNGKEEWENMVNSLFELNE